MRFNWLWHQCGTRNVYVMSYNTWNGNKYFGIKEILNMYVDKTLFRQWARVAINHADGNSSHVRKFSTWSECICRFNIPLLTMFPFTSNKFLFIVSYKIELNILCLRLIFFSTVVTSFLVSLAPQIQWLCAPPWWAVWWHKGKYQQQ